MPIIGLQNFNMNRYELYAIPVVEVAEGQRVEVVPPKPQEKTVETNQVFTDKGIPGEKLGPILDIGSAGITSVGDASTDIRIWAGATFANRATAPFRVDKAGTVTATSGTFPAPSTIAGFDVGADYVRDIANSFGLASTVTGGDDVRFWAGATFANRATAPFRVTEAGALTASSATVNGQSLARQDLFGDGSDGAVTISVDTTLTSDMFYSSLTVNNTFTLNPAGYRIFCTGTVTNNGTISGNGVNGGAGGAGGDGTAGVGGTAGSAGTAGTARADGSLPGALVGPAGQAGRVGGAVGGTGAAAGANGNAGTAGTDQATCITTTSAAGEAGGAGGSANTSAGGVAAAGTAGALGIAGVNTVTILNEIRSVLSAYLLYDPQTANWYNTSPGTGGSGSGGSGGASANPTMSAGGGGSGGSGGAGSGGRTISIFAKSIVNTGTISANGGNGGAGGNGGNGGISGGAAQVGAGGGGGGAGGSGGDGGAIILVYGALTNSGTISVTAGSAGAAGAAGTGAAANGGTGNNGNAGTAGVAGVAGTTIQLSV